MEREQSIPARLFSEIEAENEAIVFQHAMRHYHNKLGGCQSP